jgi:ABC-type branched-subunit amino acid transport system substrate-binding protein
MRPFPARLLLVVLLAACGTTVPVDAQQFAGNGVSGPGPGTSTVGGDGHAASAPGAGSGGAGSSSTTGAASGSAAAVPGGSSSAAAGPGSGEATTTAGTGEHTPVVVGFEVIQGGNQFIANGFGTPVNFGDGRKEITAIVKDVNAHGGINGHPIRPVFADWNAASGDQGRQADCATLLDDEHAQFVVTVININSAFLACVAKHGVPVVNSSLGAGDTYLYRTYRGNFFSPSLMSLNRESELLLRRLTERGVLTRGKKVGVVIDGTDPQYTRVFKTTEEPTLKALGLPYDSYTVNATADVSSAVLRFKTDGIKQVVFIAPNGIIATLFMQGAEQQGYRPTYGMGDSTSAWFAAKAAPPAQVKGFQGVGSLPLSNVEVAQYPTTPAERTCLKLIAKEGEANTDRHTSITATVYCEGIYAWTAVARKITGPITAAAWRAAYPTVGTSYRPVTTFAIDFGNGQDGNVLKYRDLAWSAGCSCVAYSGPLRPVPRS